MLFRYGGMFDHNFYKLTAESFQRKIFEIAQHLAKLWEKISCLKRPACWGTVLLKGEELT